MKKTKLFFIFLSLLVSSIGIVSLLKPGFFLTDDGNSMVIRFSAFYEALKSGQFPVRFLSRLNYGYGYPVADFLYPLFMYIGVPIKALGFSFVDTVKLILGLSFLSGTFFSFLWLRKLFDDKSAFTGSIIYSLFPYHLYDIYVRGSVGEVLALGIVPFILWQIERKNLFWTAIGISFLIVAHNSLALLFLIFISFYMGLDVFIEKNKKTIFFDYVKTLLLSFGLSAFFSLPAIFDLQYTVFSKTSVSDWSKYFLDFDLIGISTVTIFLTIFTFVWIKKIELKKHRLTLLMIGVGLVSIFFASSLSSFLWSFLPVSFIQFPFRLLSLTIVSTAFLAACVVSVLKKKNKIVSIILLLVLVFLSSKNFLTPKVFQNYPDTFYSTNQDTTTARNEYMPRWIKDYPTQMPKSKVEPAATVSYISGNSNNMSFKVSSNKSIIVEVEKNYFPGWKASIDGKKTEIINNNPKGLIQISVSSGDHIVHVYFEEGGLRLLSDFISVISLFILLGLSFKKMSFFYK